MSTEHIARRTVSFFFLTSLPNVGGVIVLAALYAAGLLNHDRDPALTYSFGAAALLAMAIVLALPALLTHTPRPRGQSSKIAAAGRFLRHSLAEGIRDALSALRRSPIAVLGGSLGTMMFDLAVLGLTFKAFGHSPPVGVLGLGYLIGQLGGNVPVPSGIGGLDGGLVATFALYHQPLAVTAAAVLVYHAISLWIPALLGSVAFVLLRGTLLREAHPTALCAPLAESIDVNADRRLPPDIAEAPLSSRRARDPTGPTALMKLT